MGLFGSLPGDGENPPKRQIAGTNMPIQLQGVRSSGSLVVNPVECQRQLGRLHGFGLTSTVD